MTILSNIWDFLNLPVDQAFERIYHSESKQWVASLVPVDKLLGTSPTPSPLVNDSNYVSVVAQKSFLPYERVLLDTFYGAVYSVMMMKDGGGELRTIASFNKLDSGLVELDKKAGNKVVAGPRTLIELAPVRGSSINGTVALMAISTGGYAEPLLSTLHFMSDTAGVKFLEPTSALVSALVSGVKMLSDAAKANPVCVGYAGNLPMQTGVFLIAACPKNQFDWADYSFADDYTLLHRNEAESRFPYIVMTIESADAKSDWQGIPDLKALEQQLNGAMKDAGTNLSDPTSDGRKAVEKALTALEWALWTSPDLCSEDGRRIAKRAREMIQAFISRTTATLTSARVDAEHVEVLTVPTFSLADIDAFPRP